MDVNDFCRELLGVQTTVMSCFSYIDVSVRNCLSITSYMFSLDIACSTLSGSFMLALLLYIVSKNLKMDS